MCPYLSPVHQPLSSGGFYSFIHQVHRPTVRGVETLCKADSRISLKDSILDT